MTSGKRTQVDKAYYYEKGKEAARAWRITALRQAFDLAVKLCSLEGATTRALRRGSSWGDEILENSDVLECGDHAKEEIGKMTGHVAVCVAAVRV